MKNRGFTLIELVVVMAVFLFIIGVAITVFLAILQHERTLLAEQKILNQISYAEEYMSKALRMAAKDDAGTCLIDTHTMSENHFHPGYIYLLTRQDTSTGRYGGIRFLNQSNIDSYGNPVCQEFFLDNSDPQNLVLKESENAFSDSMAVALTSPAIKINYIKFGINGVVPNFSQAAVGTADVQPLITILLSVQIKSDQQQPERLIQTTVSQRNLNVTKQP